MLLYYLNKVEFIRVFSYRKNNLSILNIILYTYSYVFTALLLTNVNSSY